MLIFDSSINVVIVEQGNMQCCPSVFITFLVCVTVIGLAFILKSFFTKKDAREKKIEESLLDGVKK